MSRGGVYAGALPVADHREHHRVEVLHVDRAAAPQVAVALISPENGWTDHSSASAGHHVQVAVHQQRARGDGSAPGNRATTLARPGALSRIVRLEADLGQLRRDVLGGDPLARAGAPVAGVGGVDADQVAAEVDNLFISN